MKFTVFTLFAVTLTGLTGCCGGLRNLFGDRGAPCGGCAQAAPPNYLSASPCEVGSPVVSGMMSPEYSGGAIMGEGWGGNYGYPSNSFPSEGYPVDGSYIPGAVGSSEWVPSVPQGTMVPTPSTVVTPPASR